MNIFKIKISIFSASIIRIQFYCCNKLRAK